MRTDGASRTQLLRIQEFRNRRDQRCVQAQRKYILELENHIGQKSSGGDLNDEGLELILEKNQEVYFDDIFFTLQKVKKINNKMNVYTQNYILILKMKEQFEQGIKFKRDAESGEILSVRNDFLTSSQLTNIIDILTKERHIHHVIINLFMKLEGKKLSLEFYYKCFVFVELFTGGKITEKLVPILYSFTNDRNLYSSNLNPSVFIVLKSRYMENFSKNLSKHTMIFTFSEGLRITYFSEQLSYLLKFKQEELLKQNIAVLFPDALVKPHNNLVLSYLINNKHFNFPTIHNYIFDKDKFMRGSKLNGICQPGLCKNLVTIIELELIDVGNQYLILMDTNFNLISMSKNFELNYSMTYKLLSKFNINLLKIFDIPQNTLQNRVKKFYKTIELY